MTGIYASPTGAQAVERRYRELLGRWPSACEHLTIPTVEGDTFVVACGPAGAPPLVLLHGAGGNSVAWLGDVGPWSRHFRVYAVDVIGEPGLSAPARPPLSSDAYATWLDDVLRGLGAERASFVGASLGGWLALDYAIRRPARVERLALLGPGGVGRQKWGVVIAALALRPFGAWGLRTSLRMALGVPGLEAEVVEYLMLIHRSYRPRRDVLPRFSDDALRGLTMPVLVVVGGRDGMLDSRGTAERVRRTVPGATVRLLPGTGHAVLGQAEPVLGFLLGQG